MPIVVARWLHVGVIILSRVRYRKKYIFLFFSERKFRKVKPTFWTPSRQPLNRFSWNLASLLPCVFDFWFLFPFSNNRHFFKDGADDLSPLTLSYYYKRTNVRVKNLRHVFFVERVRSTQEANAMFIVLFRSFLAGLELNLHRHVLSQNTSQLPSLLQFWAF